MVIFTSWKKCIYLSTFLCSNIWAMLADTVWLRLWWGCSARHPGPASFLVSPFTLWGGEAKSQRGDSTEIPFVCLLAAAANAIWTSLVFFFPQWVPVVLLDWAKIAFVRHAASEGHGKYFFHQKREASFSQSWEMGTFLCPEKQTCWVKRMLGLQLF